MPRYAHHCGYCGQANKWRRAVCSECRAIINTLKADGITVLWPGGIVLREDGSWLVHGSTERGDRTSHVFAAKVAVE
jgi:hypothetical protein